MPLVKATSRSKSMRQSMHYIATGVKDVTKGRINKPKPTAKKGINARNYLMEGIHARGFVLPGMSSKQEMHQYHLGLADMRYYLEQRPNLKNQSDNIVISFKPGELDWRKPNDLMAGRWIVHHFVEDAFPNNAVYTGYQMDNANQISHVHLAVNMVDEKTGFSDDKHNYFGGWKLQRVEEHVTKAWNRLHPDKYIEPWKISMLHHTLMPQQRKIVNRTKPFIKHGLDFYDLHQEAPKHGVVLNAFRKNGEKIVGAGLHDTKHVNGYAVHLMHNKPLQNKPIFMTGNMLSEYIPGVKTRQLKKTMHINTVHAREIQHATAQLERISNANQVMSNQTINNATSARSSASLNNFKSNLISSAAIANSKETSKVTTLRVTRANQIISNMTHNNQMHQAHILNATSEKANQRSQAVMTMQYHDINSQANQELQPNSSAEHTYQSHANQLHNLQASLLTSYAHRSLSSVLASSATFNSQSLATQSLLREHNQSLIKHQLHTNQSISSGYNVIDKINSIQDKQLNHQLEQHQSELVAQQKQGMASNNPTQSSQSPVIFVPGMSNTIEANSISSSVNSNVSQSTNSNLNSSVEDSNNINVITRDAQKAINDKNKNNKNSNQNRHLSSKQAKRIKNNQKRRENRAINKQAQSQVASQTNTALIIPDLMQSSINSRANQIKEARAGLASNAQRQQMRQASLAISASEEQSLDRSILSSATKADAITNSLDNRTHIKASIINSNIIKRDKSSKASLVNSAMSFMGNSTSSSSVSSISKPSSNSKISSSSISSNSRPSNQSSLNTNNNVSNSSSNSNNRENINHTNQSSGINFNHKLGSTASDYRNLFTSSANQEATRKSASVKSTIASQSKYTDSVLARTDINAKIHTSPSYTNSLLSYAVKIKNHGDLNDQQTNYAISRKMMIDLHRDKKLKQQSQGDNHSAQYSPQESSNTQSKKIKKQIEKDHGGIGGR